MKSLIPAVVLVLIAAAMLSVPAQADVKIQDIQTGVYPVGTAVEIDNVVVTAVGFFNFFVQEPDPDPNFPNRTYSGIQIFTNGNHTVHKGDLVNVQGTYAEYNDMSELDATQPGSFVTYIGSGTIPTPMSCLISDVNDAGALAEAYESVLIRVDTSDNTLYADSLNAYNEWYLRTNPINSAGGDSLLMDQYSAKPGDDFEYDVPAPNSLLTFAQGILVYNYAQYKLAPRNCETDLGTGCKPKVRGTYSTSTTNTNVQFGIAVEQASAENPSNYLLASGNAVLSALRDAANHKVVHLTTQPLGNGLAETISVSNVRGESGGVLMDPGQTFDFRSGITPIYQIQYVPNPETNDASALANQIVTVQGRVTGVGGNYYYLQDGDGTAWRGLYSRVSKTGNMAIGDSVQCSGLVNEYFNATQISYRSGVDNFHNFGRAPRPLTVNVVGANQIPYRGSRTAEPWEYGLVKLPNASLLDSIPGTPGPYFGEWQMRQVTNPVYPDTAGCALSIFPVSYDPCPGDRIDMTGILRYEYARYRLAPRCGRGCDINVIFDSPMCQPTGVQDEKPVAVLALEQNRPNPSGPGTLIRFSLPSISAVSLDVLDVSGRLVKTLVAGPLAAGEHSLRWDGTDQKGHAAAAGTYFYRLRSDGRELSRKMVLLP